MKSENGVWFVHLGTSKTNNRLCCNIVDKIKAAREDNGVCLVWDKRVFFIIEWNVPFSGAKTFFFFQQMKGYARTESVETTKTDFVWDYFTLSTA